MSWQTGTGVVEKHRAAAAIDGCSIMGDLTPAVLDQFAAAKRIAQYALQSVPGPFVRVSMGGHANGTGWTKPEGFGPDFITITVQQEVAAQ